jgi:hypothetical protein
MDSTITVKSGGSKNLFGIVLMDYSQDRAKKG